MSNQIVGVWHAVVGSLLDAEDDFLQRLRKCVVIAFFLPGSFFTFSVAALTMLRACSVGDYLVVAMGIICSIVLPGSYFLLRARRYVTTSHMTMTLWIVNIAWVFMVIGAPDAPIQSFCFTFAATAVMTRVARPQWLLGFGALQFAVSIWNNAMVWGNDGDFDRGLVMPDTLGRTSVLYNLAAGVFGLVTMALCLVVFHLQVQEAERRGRQQHAANRMTLEILKCQRRYDTVKIAEILRERAIEQVVDSELLQLYATMNTNLQSYRPFLPNYLFLETSGEDSSKEESQGDMKEGEGVDSRDDDGSHLSYTDLDRSQSKSSLHSSELESALGSTGRVREVVVEDVSSTQLSPVEQHLERILGGDAGELRNNPLTWSFGGPARSGSDEQSPRRRPHSGHKSMLPSSTPWFCSSRSQVKVVTFAVVDLQGQYLAVKHDCAIEHDSERRDKSGSTERVSALVNLIYSLAKETKASVHSMLGDTVQLTWNATSDVALPETKGATFLHKLHSTINRTGQSAVGCQVAGAVCSGPAFVHSVITTVTQQFALVIEAPCWMPVLQGCFDLAKRHQSSSVMLMDERTARACSLSIEACPVEEVYHTTTALTDSSRAEEQPVGYRFLFHHPRQQDDNRNGVRSTTLAYDSRKTMTPPQAPHPNVPSTIAAGAAGSATAATLVFSILGEKQREQDLEWMYQLTSDETTTAADEESRSNANDSVIGWQRKALSAAAHGRFFKAAHAIEMCQIQHPFVPLAPTTTTPPVTCVVGDKHQLFSVFQDALLRYVLSETAGGREKQS